MKTKKEIIFFVNYGIDYSHKFDSKYFDKLKDAKNFIEKMPSQYQSYELVRREEIYERISHGKYHIHPISSKDKVLEDIKDRRNKPKQKTTRQLEYEKKLKKMMKERNKK